VYQYVRILEQVVQDFPPFIGSQVRDDTAFIRIALPLTAVISKQKINEYRKFQRNGGKR